MNARQAIAEANKELDAQCVAAGIPSDYGYLTEAGQLADLAWSKQRVAVFLETEPGWKDIKDADGWLHLHLHVNAVWTGTALEVVKKALGGG